MDQKLSSKLLFIYSANSDGFYEFHISQGNVATQLRCGGIFSNHFITDFPPVKKKLRIGQHLTKIWTNTKLCGLLFGPPCIMHSSCHFRHFKSHAKCRPSCNDAIIQSVFLLALAKSPNVKETSNLAKGFQHFFAKKKH